ncbi:MAG TPA: VOC family protein [Acidimicrobiales bacterium]|nr:VOC family protein [Acidimicrobiales bacterium]
MTLRFEIFPSDLDATADFYTRVLRFEVTADRRDDPVPYMAFRRDAVHVGAARSADGGYSPERRPPVGVELVLEVDDIDTELELARMSGWSIDEEVQDRPWGLRDFRLIDPSGYYLRVTNRKTVA